MNLLRKQISAIMSFIIVFCFRDFTYGKTVET